MRLEKLRAAAANADTFIDKAKRCTAFSELAPEGVRRFIVAVIVDNAMEPGEEQTGMAQPIAQLMKGQQKIS